MFENADSGTLPDDYVVNRMFELVQQGQTDCNEFALLDALIQARLREAYPADGDQAPSRVRTAA